MSRKANEYDKLKNTDQLWAVAIDPHARMDARGGINGQGRTFLFSAD